MQTLNNNNLGIYVITLIIILILVLFIYIGLNIINKNIKKKNNKTSDQLSKLNTKVENIIDSNDKVVKINKQINDKSEVISKIMEQTNDIYREILKTEQASHFSKKELDIDKPLLKEQGIDFSQKEQASIEPGEHLTELVSKINNSSDAKREQIKEMTSKFNFDSKEVPISEKEILDLIHNLQNYESVLNEEMQYYFSEINKINENKEKLEPKVRLEKKETIFNELKLTEEKIEEQEKLMKKILLYKVEIDAITHEKEKIETEENKLDDMIKKLEKKR